MSNLNSLNSGNSLYASLDISLKPLGSIKPQNNQKPLPSISALLLEDNFKMSVKETKPKAFSNNLPIIKEDSKLKPIPTPSFNAIKNGSRLKQGDRSPEVKDLQSKLTKLGFPVRNTGYFGPVTETALKNFQRANGIQATGILGPTTLAVIESAEKGSKSVFHSNKNVLGTKLAKTAEKVARNKNTVGWCYSGVATAVARAVGVELWGDSAYMAAKQLASSRKFNEVKVPTSSLRSLPAGAIVVWGKTKDSPHGHISVALGDGREASDHIDRQRTNLRGYTNARVFVPVA
jgi:peptidoglycan hydrolase-like protein with peptidoglycan-binding domain